MTADTEVSGSGVLLRCSAVVVRGRSVLLVHRTDPPVDDWVLPGGNPRPGETLVECLRREVAEETGLDVETGGVAFVVEAIEPGSRLSTIDVIFTAFEPVPGRRPTAPESGLVPQFVTLDRMAGYRLRPPIVDDLARHVADGGSRAGAYLGNRWRVDGPRRAAHGPERTRRSGRP